MLVTEWADVEYFNSIPHIWMLWIHSVLSLHPEDEEK